jgi:ribose transport system substrate-binding protein
MKIQHIVSFAKTVALSTAIGAATLTAGFVQADTLKIAFTGYSTDQPFWVGVGSAAAAQAKEMGVEFIDLTATEADAAAQKDAVDRAITMGVDGIIIGAVDNRGFNETLNRAMSKKIPVVTVDTAIKHKWVKSLVQTDNLAAASIAGEFIVDNMKPGKVLILGGSQGHQTGNARRDGVKNKAEAAGHEVLFRICDWAEACAYDTTINETMANNDITAIFAASDPMALSAVAAAKERGILDNLVIVGFDGNPGNLKSIANGAQTADIKQDNVKMGSQAVINLVNMINGKSVAEFTGIDGILITKENVKDFM